MTPAFKKTMICQHKYCNFEPCLPIMPKHVSTCFAGVKRLLNLFRWSQEVVSTCFRLFQLASGCFNLFRVEWRSCFNLLRGDLGCITQMYKIETLGRSCCNLLRVASTCVAWSAAVVATCFVLIQLVSRGAT